MKTLEELEKEYAEKRDELQQQIVRASLLPLPPDSFCGAKWKAPYITYRKTTLCGYPKIEYTPREAALFVIDHFAMHVTPMRAVKNGCISIAPAVLQDKRYCEDEATLLYHADVTLKLEGGNGFSTTEFEFYSLHSGQHFHVSIECTRKPEWNPTRYEVNTWRPTYQREANPEYRYTPAAIGEDSMTKFGGGSDNSYRIVYGWKTLDSFKNWMVNTLPLDKVTT